MKINPRKKRRHAAGGGVSSFLAWADFHPRSRFARPTIPEEKWGTTRSLREGVIGQLCPLDSKRLSISFWSWEIISKKMSFETLGNGDKQCAGIFSSAYFEYQLKVFD